MQLERTPEWSELSINHLEGRTSGFFCYDDEGGDVFYTGGWSNKLRHKEWFD